MPTIWNENTERQLLLLIIHLTAPKLPDWSALSDLMGEEFTGSACRQHYQAMRKKAKTQYGDFGPGAANASTAQRALIVKKPAPAMPTTVYVTSSATQTPGKAAASASPAGKRKGKEIEDDRDDEEMPDAETSVGKRVKKEEDNKDDVWA